MTIETPRPVNPETVVNPPEGVRLELISIATALNVTLTALADAAHVSRSTMSRIATNNSWPATYDKEQIKAAVLAHLALAGATDQQLESAFWRHVIHRQTRGGASRNEKNAAYLKRLEEGDAKRQASIAAAELRNGSNHINFDEDETDMIIAKQILDPATRRHFGLTFRNPFDSEVTEEAQMYQGGEVAYVREAAWQCARTASFVAIVGESGSGKTTIVSDLEARIDQEAKECIVIRPGVLGMEGSASRGKVMKSADILDAIIKAIDESATVPQTLQARTRKAQSMLTASAAAGNNHLLVIEEAHSLPDSTLKHLKRMHEMRAGRKPMLGILLVAQPELQVTLQAGLRGGHLREVAQRIEIVQLLPLDAELQPYLTHRAKAAGRNLDEFINSDAIDALRDRLTKTIPSSTSRRRTVSLCYPLAVNNWMTRLLNEAASLGIPKITRELVQSV